MLDKTITSSIIRNARLESGMTQEQLAEKVYVTKQAVSNWERGINSPDEETREFIEQILKIKLRDEKMSKPATHYYSKKTFNLKPLADFDNLEDLNSSVEQLIDTLEIDAYAHVVKQLLFKTILVVLGYDIYFLGHCRNYYTECPLDWPCVASDLESVYNDRDDWLIRDSACPFDAKSKLTQKMRIMSFNIGAELFEDFDESGYRDTFVQKIGRLAQDCEDDLSNLLPAFNTDIMVVYKIALLDTIDIMRDI